MLLRDISIPCIQGFLLATKSTAEIEIKDSYEILRDDSPWDKEDSRPKKSGFVEPLAGKEHVY